MYIGRGMDATEIQKKLNEANAKRDDAFKWLSGMMDDEVIDVAQSLIEAWIEIKLLEAARDSLTK